MRFSTTVNAACTNAEFTACDTLGADAGRATSGATGGGQSAWPFIGHQGAGAFLALTIVGLWLSRSYLKETWNIAFRGRGGDGSEPISYRLAYLGVGICFVGLVAWSAMAGLRGLAASLVIGLSFLYMIAAARIRAETGNAWLFGPEVDVYRVMTTSFGTAVYTPVDLPRIWFHAAGIPSAVDDRGTERSSIRKPDVISRRKHAEKGPHNSYWRILGAILSIVISIKRR